MRSYITHGTGRTTKVLFTPPFGAARTVTSAPADRAQRIAWMLGRTSTQIPAALFQPAVRLDGAPFEARRHLLAVFDAVSSGRGWAVVDQDWESAQALAADLGQTVQGLPSPVVASVRAEYAQHLAGMDGVLVPARANNAFGRGGHLDLVISPALHSDRLWDDLGGEYGDLGVRPDDASLPLGGPLAVSSVWAEIVADFHDAEPTEENSFAPDMADLRARVGEGEELDLNVRVDHLLAFVAHHFPTHLEQVRVKLTI